MSSQHEIREQVTAKIVAALEQDLLPWRRMWNATGNPAGTPTSLARSHTRGVNPSLAWKSMPPPTAFAVSGGEHFGHGTSLVAESSLVQMMFEPGQWGCGIVVYIPITKEVEDPKTGEEEEETYLDAAEVHRCSMPSKSKDCSADLYQALETATDNTTPDFEPAEQLIQATGADIRFGGDRAFYRCPTPKAVGLIIEMATGFRCRPNHLSSAVLITPPFCTNLAIGVKCGSVGIVKRTPMRWASWWPKSLPASSQPNSAFPTRSHRKPRRLCQIVATSDERRRQLHLQGVSPSVESVRLPALIRETRCDRNETRTG